MLKPPASPYPGMTDSLEFVKNLWGSMHLPGVGVPGMAGPVLSTDELDKRIADLKAVESWLNLNMTMLRGTIQALEVQRGTIATLKTMGATMAQAMGQAGGAGAGAMPFGQFFTPPGMPGGQPGPQAGQPPGTPASQPKQPEPAAKDTAGEAPGAEAMPAAVAWWNMLQDQFRQAVSSAMSPEAIAGATAMAQDAAARFAGAVTPPGEAGTPSGAGNASAQPGTAQPRTGKPKPDKA